MKTIALQYAKGFAVCFAIFWGLLIAVSIIPISLIQDNALESGYQNLLDDTENSSHHESRFASTFTTSIMLSMCVSAEGNPLIDSVEGLYLSDSDLEHRVSDTLEKGGDTQYPRYWHGWLSLLKPLLIITDYAGIKIILLGVFALLLCAVSIELSRTFKYGFALSAALTIALSAANCFYAEEILPFAFPQLLSMIGILLVLKYYPENQTAKWMAGTFFVLGALTTYFDFLIIPLLVYLLPAIFVALIDCSLDKPLKTVFFGELICGISWAIGYGSLWFSKWVLASIVLGENIIANAAQTALFRVGATNTSVEMQTVDKPSAMNAITENLSIMSSKIIVIGAVLIVLFCVMISLRRTSPIHYKNCILALLPFLFLPYAWYTILSNHSTIHYYFTYRLQVASVLTAELIVLVSLFAFKHRSMLQPNPIHWQCSEEK